MKSLFSYQHFVLLLLLWIPLSGCALLTPKAPSEENWARFDTAKVQFDRYGVATVEAKDWGALIEAQGYVVASDRLWQMDFSRRVAAGRLSEWFGEVSFPHDRKQRQEDWLAAADQAYADLPADERHFADRYSEGVNRYIAAHQGNWGYEYQLLNSQPEAWSGRDCLLIMLYMSSQLSSIAEQEALQSRWRKVLPAPWEAFLFATEHPWNVPLRGKKGAAVALPPRALWLPLGEPERGQETGWWRSNAFGGSNNWAWRGNSERFLANDPHLPHSVPNTWYAIRLRISAQEWVVGVSIPGIPGVVLGMNAHLAWAFTNTEEDADDYLLETLDAKGKRYRDHDEQGKAVWRPLEIRTSQVKIRDEAPREVEARFTHRGPLAKRKYLGEGFYSRQWLGFQPGTIRLATLRLNRARNWQEVNAALDTMRSPAQNVLVMDHQGNMGYRTSGTGINRRVTGRLPQPAEQGEWLSLQPPSQRLRLWKAADSALSPQYFATANQRIWVDTFEHPWGGDERADRIRTVLGSSKWFSRQAMQALQHDDHSRYHLILLRWVAQHALAADVPAQEILNQWQAWDGNALTDPQVFKDALVVNRMAYEVLISRVKKFLLPEQDQALPYVWRRYSAWVLAMMADPQGTQVFGLEAKDLANLLLAEIVQNRQQRRFGYAEENRWRTQHPLSRLYPLAGRRLRVPEPRQVGYLGLLKKEQPSYGATVRIVWDLKNLQNSVWSFPLGQSGRVDSPHYADTHALWFQQRYWPALDDRYSWQ